MLQSLVHLQLHICASKSPANGTLDHKPTANMTLASKTPTISLAPLVFETLGAINVEGEEVASHDFSLRFQALGTRVHFLLCGRAWARVFVQLAALSLTSYPHVHRWS